MGPSRNRRSGPRDPFTGATPDVRSRVSGDVQSCRRKLCARFLLILAAGKIIATSLTLGIGGSGGIFAPSLFIGVTSGMAFGVTVNHLFGQVPAIPRSTPWWPWAQSSPPPHERH